MEYDKITQGEFETYLAHSGSVRRADLTGMDFSGIERITYGFLTWCNLSGVDLSRVNFLESSLRGSDLSGATVKVENMRAACLEESRVSGLKIIGDVPVIEDIHRKVYEAASQDGALDMNHWHSECGTTHCRAGWVIALAGEAGKALESEIGTNAAASLIYAASDPNMDRVPNWFAKNKVALEDMKQIAGL